MRAEQSNTELGEGLLARPDFTHPLAGTEHRRAGMIIQRFMIKSESLQYTGHGHWTGSRISIADLDRNAPTIRKSNRIDRLSPSFGNQTGDGTMQF